METEQGENVYNDCREMHGTWAEQTVTVASA